MGRADVVSLSGKELDRLERAVMAYTPDHAVGDIDEGSDVCRVSAMLGGGFSADR